MERNDRADLARWLQIYAKCMYNIYRFAQGLPIHSFAKVRYLGLRCTCGNSTDMHVRIDQYKQ